MNVGQRIKQRRIELNMDADDLAAKIGKSRATIYRYENGDIENMPTTVLEPIAAALHTTPAYLMGWNAGSVNVNTCTAVKINVLGRVAAGIPISAVEEIIDTEEISEDMAAKGEYFGLLIKGDSMEPRICDGDVVIVRQQDDAESGEIVIAIVNGNDATCKRLLKYAGGISLISLNSKYEPITFSDKEILEKPVRIIGKVVELRGKL